MKYLLIFAVVGVIGLFFMRQSLRTKYHNMSAKEADSLLRKQQAVLVDVREKDELAAEGMAQGAVWMATSKVQSNDPSWQQFKAGLDKSKTVILYCKIGGRAGKVAQLLEKEGFKTGNIGGFSAWKAAQLPTVPCAECR